MAYGFHPQLYPYLYAPKNPLSLSSSGYEQSMSDRSISPPLLQPKSSKDEEKSSSGGEVSKAATTDEECMIDESENVEID